MRNALLIMTGATLLLAGCATERPTRELAFFPLDDTQDVIAQTDVHFDQAESTDGHGSLQVVASGPTVVRLFEVADPGPDLAHLSYEANIKTDGVEGQVYLEMWCRFPGQGEYFSRALYAPLTGSNQWTQQSTGFFLKKGQRPDLVRLNLVVDGKGTAWIDDIHLYGTPI